MPISLEQFAAFVADHPLGVVSTRDPARGPEAALVSFAVTDDGAILFDTFVDSRKVANLAADGRVAIVLGCSGPVSIQVEGTAYLPSVEERATWAAEYERRLPGSRATRPELTVVRVEPHWLRVYEVAASGPVDREGTPPWSRPGVDSASGPQGPWRCCRDEPVPDDVARLLATVPEWFGLPEANAEYIDAARAKETWTVRDVTGAVIGVTLVDRHFPHVAEIHLTVVERAHHGQGVGTAMLSAIEADSRERGVKLLEVKTLGESHPDAGYARTRHFYEKVGFLPLEETDLWGELNPCLFLVKPL
jgi:GNAT superfamily N-acetyltransferase/general stress protein 26